MLRDSVLLVDMLIVRITELESSSKRYAYIKDIYLSFREIGLCGVKEENILKQNLFLNQLIPRTYSMCSSLKKYKFNSNRIYLFYYRYFYRI